MNADPFLSLLGAVAADDLGVPSHFGSPLIEQRALDSGDAFVSLSHHGVITVSGEDRLSWLHSMLSQHLSTLSPHESVEALLLDPQGRIERVARVVDDGERTWLLVDAGEADPLAEFLNRMRFAMRVEVTDVSDDYATVLAFEGGRALPALRDAEITVVEWRDPWRHLAAGGVQYSQSDHPGETWSAVHSVVRRADLEKVAQLVAGGAASAAGTDALNALEVRAWRPSKFSEVDARSLPHELDWLRTAVHLNKGCYRGQETVAKVHNLGHPPRRLTFLQLDGSGGQLPEAGALVFLADAGPDSRPVGRLTRSVLHYDWGGIALALLKRSVEIDAPLAVQLADSGEWIAAAQEVIVPPSAGSARHVPRLPRL